MISIIDKKVGRESLLVILGLAIALLPDHLDNTLRCAERRAEDTRTTTRNIRRHKRKRARPQESQRKITRWLGRQEIDEIHSEMKYEDYPSSCDTCKRNSLQRNSIQTLQIDMNNNTNVKRTNRTFSELDNAVEMSLILFAFVSQFLACSFVWHDQIVALHDTSKFYFSAIPRIISNFVCILLVAGIITWMLFQVTTILFNGFVETYEQRQQAMTTTQGIQITSVPLLRRETSARTLSTMSTATLSSIEDNEDNSCVVRESTRTKERITKNTLRFCKAVACSMKFPSWP